MLTDKQGNVYRDKGNGNMQQMDKNGKWQDTKPSTGSGPRATQPSTKPSVSPDTRQQLDRDMQNRDRGQQRSNNYQNYQRSPSSRSGGGGDQHFEFATAPPVAQEASGHPREQAHGREMQRGISTVRQHAPERERTEHAEESAKQTQDAATPSRRT